MTRIFLMMALLGTLLLGVLAGGLWAADTAPATPPAEPPAPAASPAVQKLLEEVRQRSKEGQPAAALGAAERALVAARQAQDAAGEARAHRERARQMEGLDRNPEASAAWREAASAWQRAGDGPGQVEALAAAAALVVRENPGEAQGLVEQAVALARAEPRRPLATARSLNQGGVSFYNRGQRPEAERLWREALAIHEKHAPGSLDAAPILNNLGFIASLQGNLAAARDYYQRAVAIYENHTPNSLNLAASLSGLGNVTYFQGELAAARNDFERALAILEKHAPGSPDVAASLGNLGNVAKVQGDLTAARGFYQRALDVMEKRTPGSLDVAKVLNNLGTVAYSQGDATAARDYYQRALGLCEKHAPGSLDVAGPLNNLGMLAFSQGDRAVARDYYQRALDLFEKPMPVSLSVAKGLNNLGLVAHEQGDLIAARDYFQRALEIRGKLAPESLDVATSLNNLGVVARAQGDLAAARDLHQRALAIREKQAPASLDVAASLGNLGNIAQDQGDLAAARGYYQRTVAIRQKYSPGSLDLAYSLSRLDSIARVQRNWSEAERLARQAWSIVRQQATSVAGDEARQAFGSSTAHYAADLIGAQFARRKLAPGFATLEESRAQALQQLLLERHLPAGAGDARLWTEYRMAVATRDRAGNLLSLAGVAETRARRDLATTRRSGASPEARAGREADVEKASEQFAQAQSAYIGTRLKVDELWAKIQAGAPRVFPAPLSLAQAARVLPPGTLYVAFSVGPEQTHLFLLASGRGHQPSLSVYPIPIPARDLEKRVVDLREAATDAKAAVPSASRTLFAALFPPAAQKVVLGGQRLLISPDGPLWEAPFAALVVNAQGAPRYLGLEKPLTYTPSLSVFAQCRTDTPPLASGGTVQAVVIGDPLFDRTPSRALARSLSHSLALSPPRPAAGGERSILFAGGEVPRPLPGTGEEARAIARLYGSAPLLEEAATEVALRQRITTAHVVHLATHGYLDPVRAMSSGILLTVPEKEPAPGETANDGFLQAWEIQSELKLRAELVVLSACETGRGERVQGEGIVGLTRALQCAGARSIVASQWKVADASTAALMVAFHRKLRGGQAKDEALQEAMRAVRENPRTAHPHYWAGFLLIGAPENGGLGSHARSEFGSK